jgi:hypothetical protein
MASALLAIDSTVSVSDSLERGALPHAVTHPSFSSFMVTLSSPTPAIFERSLPSRNLLSHPLLLESSEKTIDGSSSHSAPAISDCSSNDSSGIVPQSNDPEVLGTTPVVSAVMVDDLELEPPQSVLLDSEAVKDSTSPLLGQLSISQPQEPEHKNELLHNCVLSSVVGGARELDTDTQDPSDHQLHDFDCDSDNETFDYQGIDWAPEILVIPPTTVTEIQATPSSSPLLESRHDFSFGAAPLPPEKNSASASSPEPAIDTDKISAAVAQKSTARFALDDIGVGIKYKGDSKTTLITRCASADNLSGTVELVEAIHGIY